jgi:transcriptional regulator GlxA family with amidase domain
MPEIADETGVEARELQATFTRDHGVSPMEYLRRVRLEGAHCDLQSHVPIGGDTVATVSAVAHRWGFANPRLFAALYRAMYGRAPGGTLGEDPA